jgi:hypothetical protein
MVAQWGMSDKVGPVNLRRGKNIRSWAGVALPKRNEEMAGSWTRRSEDHHRGGINDGNIDRKRHTQRVLAEALMKEEVPERADVEDHQGTKE